VAQEPPNEAAQDYCADTSALFDLKEHWQMAVFPSLWTRIDVLIEEGRLLAPHAVLEEIRRGDDELVAWANERAMMFRPVTAAVLGKAKEVLARFPELVDPLKQHEDADPYVVAQALLDVQQDQASLFGRRTTCAVLTQEHRRIGRIRIPHACGGFGIECFDFRELFRREGWTI
jgi:hypothetical protein